MIESKVLWQDNIKWISCNFVYKNVKKEKQKKITHVNILYIAEIALFVKK